MVEPIEGKNRISHNETVINRFTKHAQEYNSSTRDPNHYGLNQMFRFSEPKEEDTILDVACGQGIVSCEYAKLVNHVTGIDLTPAMIEQAKQLQKEKRLNNVDWKVGDVSKLPFNDESFSMVMTRAIFHHMIDPEKVLVEMIRVCKTGGKILVAEVTPDKDKKERFNHLGQLREPSHTKALTLEELTEMMKNFGIVNIKSEPFDLKMDLELELKLSSPKPEDRDKIIKLFKRDLDDDSLGMNSHLKDNQIHFNLPMTLILGFKGK